MQLKLLVIVSETPKIKEDHKRCRLFPITRKMIENDCFHTKTTTKRKLKQHAVYFARNDNKVLKKKYDEHENSTPFSEGKTHDVRFHIKRTK